MKILRKLSLLTLFLVSSFSTVSTARAEEIRTAIFTGTAHYGGLASRSAVKITVNAEKITNIDSVYQTYPLKLYFAVCNRSYAPETASTTRCKYLATKSTAALYPGESVTDLTFNSGGFKKVPAGTYRAVLFLTDATNGGVYDWINFSKTIKIHK